MEWRGEERAGVEDFVIEGTPEALEYSVGLLRVESGHSERKGRNGGGEEEERGSKALDSPTEEQQRTKGGQRAGDGTKKVSEAVKRRR